MASNEKRQQHFDDTTTLSCTIETSHYVKDHMEYVIRVHRGSAAENTWQVTRRYNDFVVLDGVLRQSNIDLPLPPKRMFGNMERDFILERQQGLQEYLSALVSQPLLVFCMVVKKFLDPKNYSEKLQEVALQHVSMYFRSEPGWEVVEPLPEIGWRLRKQYFLVKTLAQTQKSAREIMYWTSYGPYLHIPDKELTSFIKLLPTIDHPYIYPVTMATANDSGVMVMRPFNDKGTLRDHICKAKPKGASFLKKYGRQKLYQLPNIAEIRILGRQILEGLKFLYDKNIPYGHLHTGNIVLDEGRCRLSDLENSLIGLPSIYRERYCQIKRLQTLEQLDVYNFGHVLYEMVCGEPLNTEFVKDLPETCPQQLRE